MSTQEHWESMYASKGDQDLSWTQSEPRTSLSLISEVCPAGRVIDVGGGTSLLAERLLGRGYWVAVLDISQTAIDRARHRLGDRASQVHWIVADVTAYPDLGSFVRYSTFSRPRPTERRTLACWSGPFLRAATL